MGFLDRFSAQKSSPEQANPGAAAPGLDKKPGIGGVLPLLANAREKLKVNDLPAAMAIYEEVLAGAADRADVLMTISADLGTAGHVHEIIDLLAPRYDVQKHGAAAGINLLQAYLASRNAEAAQHLLDLLFSLQRPELEARLVGFSNAIAEMFVTDQEAMTIAVPERKISMVSISKPIWSYGLDALNEKLLARPEGRLRRVAFVQLARPGIADAMEQAARPEDENERLTRAFPLWLAETFACSAGYDAIAAVGLMGQEHYALFPMEWAAENIRQLTETTEKGLDYVVTGWLRVHNADFELGLRIWEVKKSRELKSFTVRYAPATADEALLKIHEQVRTYMEWQALPAGNGLAYAQPAAPYAYLQGLGASVSLFLGGKNLLPAAQQPPDAAPFVRAAQANPGDTRAQLALVTALMRFKGAGAAVDEAALARARAWLASDAAPAAGVTGVEL